MTAALLISFLLLGAGVGLAIAGSMWSVALLIVGGLILILALWLFWQLTD